MGGVESGADRYPLQTEHISSLTQYDRKVGNPHSWRHSLNFSTSRGGIDTMDRSTVVIYIFNFRSAGDFGGRFGHVLTYEVRRHATYGGWWVAPIESLPLRRQFC